MARPNKIGVLMVAFGFAALAAVASAAQIGNQEKISQQESKSEKESGNKNETNVKQHKVPAKALREVCLLYTSPSPRDQRGSRMPSSA